MLEHIPAVWGWRLASHWFIMVPNGDKQPSTIVPTHVDNLKLAVGLMFFWQFLDSRMVAEESSRTGTRRSCKLHTKIVAIDPTTFSVWGNCANLCIAMLLTIKQMNAFFISVIVYFGAFLRWRMIANSTKSGYHSVIGQSHQFAVAILSVAGYHMQMFSFCSA